MSGSSVATTSAVGSMALPELQKRGYPRRFAAGLTASGGTLGILIPPSIPLMLYGAITAESIGELYIAGILPGLLSICLCAVYVFAFGRRQVRKNVVLGKSVSVRFNYGGGSKFKKNKKNN